jgi:hypothetical protein
MDNSTSGEVVPSLTPSLLVAGHSFTETCAFVIFALWFLLYNEPQMDAQLLSASWGPAPTPVSNTLVPPNCHFNMILHLLDLFYLSSR